MCGPLAAQDVFAELQFVRHVAPLLQAKCIACHGDSGAEIAGGLDLRTVESTMRGGDSEVPAVVMGEPESSPLYLAATRKHADWSAMPPKEAERLTDEQLSWLTQLSERPAPFTSQENTQGFDEQRYLEMRRGECLATLAELDDVLLANAQHARPIF